MSHELFLGKMPTPTRFFAWVLTASIPFYVWGVIAPVRGLPFGLPATALMVVVPSVVATSLTWRGGGSRAAFELWLQIRNVGRPLGAGWLVLAIFVMPLATFGAYAVMLILGLPLPIEFHLSADKIPLAFAIYFVGAVLEEVGWTGFATRPLQQRHGVLGAGLIIGAVWALWHLIPWRFGQDHTPVWVVGQFVATILMRIVMGAIYAHGGRSLLAAAIFHTMINVSSSFFPNGGSHYDPRVIAGVLFAVACCLVAWPTARDANPSNSN